MPTTEAKEIRLLGTCPDQVGLVARVTRFIADRACSIRQAAQYDDPRSRTFFMRYSIDASRFDGSAGAFASAFQPLAEELEMEWRVVDATVKKRVVLLVSKFDHCLAYLLHRWKVGDLDCEIPLVISNHEDLRSLVEWYGIPFEHVPVSKDPDKKREAFETIASLIDTANPDTIVLARYMQIFPPWLCEKYRHRVINIHHSFLPAFAGAKPYHQADERGVKLVGATCHYVTEDLDAGPIIEQGVVRIRHNHSIEDMIRNGKDVENTVLARGLRLHLDDRVLVHGNKTIVLE